MLMYCITRHHGVLFYELQNFIKKLDARIGTIFYGGYNINWLDEKKTENDSVKVELPAND